MSLCIQNLFQLEYPVAVKSCRSKNDKSLFTTEAQRTQRKSVLLLTASQSLLTIQFSVSSVPLW